MADYRHMYETRKFTDIVLVVGRSGSAQLPVHKAILAARSPVFAAMFEHDTLEKAKNRVVIPDIEEDIAEAMIKFLYYADTTVLEEFACELLLVADKVRAFGESLFGCITLTNANPLFCPLLSTVRSCLTESNLY